MEEVVNSELVHLNTHDEILNIIVCMPISKRVSFFSLCQALIV